VNERIDLVVGGASDGSGDEAPEGLWLGVWFECAGQYVRVYRRPDQAFYRACCPRCARVVRFRVGRDGTSSRFFRVHC